MSDKLPFEDTFKDKMNELPTGDLDASWQKMKQLLDEKERPKPFAWLNIYTIGLALIIAAIGIWILLSDNHQKNNRQKQNALVDKKNGIVNENAKPNENTTVLNPDHTNKTSIQKHETNEIAKLKKTEDNKFSARANNHASILKNINQQIFDRELSAQGKETSNKNFIENVNKILADTKENNNVMTLAKTDSFQSIEDSLKNIVQATGGNENLKSASVADEEIDSVITQNNADRDLNQPSNFDSTSINISTPISLKQKLLIIEAGMQLKQQIPISGQQITAYNYSGNKELIKDYIPSVFINLHNNGRWFLHSEFSYAVPHLIRQFSYSRQTTVDYSLSTISVTTANLQKTYYNELALSYNYYLQPHWLIGAGVLFSKFCGAVAEQEVTTRNVKGGIYTTTKTMIPFKNFTDSFLYKNQASLIFQTGYELGKWSFILKYERGIQPYITYTLPNGSLENKYNSSLELNIGYRFIRKPFKHSVTK